MPGTMNVTEVALATGFSDSNYFGRVFQKEVGVTPGAVPPRPARQRCRNSSNRATKRFLSSKTDSPTCGEILTQESLHRRDGLLQVMLTGLSWSTI